MVVVLATKERKSGWKLSEETRRRMSLARTGIKLSESHRAILSAAHKGKTLSEEHKQRISAGVRKSLPSTAWKKNRVPWNAGKRWLIPWNKGKRGIYSIETLRKMSISSEGRPAWNRGRRGYLPKDVRKKMSDAKVGKPTWNKGMVGYRAGEQSHLWKGGRTSLRAKIRSCLFYKNWRESVFKRDGYSCQGCDVVGGYLEVDHIKPFALILTENKIDSLESAMKCQELWDVSNGRTLCRDCHKKTSTYPKNLAS
jgi:hypothetical protein